VAPPEDYVPKGEVKDVQGVHTYVVGEGPKAVIVFPDLFGVNSGRTKQVCDEISAWGYLVVLPDCFEGLPFKDDESLVTFPKVLCNILTLKRFFKRNAWANVGHIYEEKVIPYLRSEGVESIGAVTFCWGSYAAVHLASGDDIQAGVHFHPAITKVAGLAGEKYQNIFEKAKSPQMFLASNPDPGNIKAGGICEQILNSNEQLNGRSVFYTFKDMKHGWVNRGDLNKEKIRRDYTEAMRRAREYLETTM